MKTILSTAAIILFFAACSSTRITHSWSVENRPAKKFNMGHEYGKMIVQDMIKRNVLTKSEIIAKD